MRDGNSLELIENGAVFEAMARDIRAAHTGGWGIWRVWDGNGASPDEWRDTAVRVHGPVVADMQRAFEQSWREAGGAPLPADDYPPLAPVGPTPAAFVASSPRGGHND